MNEAKKKDILDLLRMTIIQPESVDQIVPTFVQQEAVLKRSSEVDLHVVAAIVKEQILNDLFIEQFIEPFDQSFTHEEIKNLVSIYQSKVMKKFNQKGPELFNPIYEAYRPLIQKVFSDFYLIAK